MTLNDDDDQADDDPLDEFDQLLDDIAQLRAAMAGLGPDARRRLATAWVRGRYDTPRVASGDDRDAGLGAPG
jgi:hypothetical protein